MKPEDEKRVAANLARIMAMLCVRNTQLERLHSGLTPVTRIGDYSDVFVVDADGAGFAKSRTAITVSPGHAFQ